MDKFLSSITLLLLITSLNAQDASKIYVSYVNSTITIETDHGLGSGFFVSENIIVTNYHVVEGVTEAFCYSPNSFTKYNIDGCLAIDQKNDLVLLQVLKLNKPSLKISEDQIIPGQRIYVIGSPKGLPATISDGIISGLRDFNDYKLIQITAPISEGSSGGPVLNENGELIGISVGQITEAQNINFAIPAFYLKELLSRKADFPTSFDKLFDKKGIINDQRDRNIYKTIKIGSQIWMAENLNFAIDNGSWCYDKNTRNCNIYGRLYTWENAKKSCPNGWHLPASYEWMILINYLGGDENAGLKLKSKTGWSNPGDGTTLNVTDESSFSGLPGGFYTIIDTFVGVGYQGYFWSSTIAEDIIYADAIRLYFLTNEVGWYNHNLNSGLSVRCVKD